MRKVLNSFTSKKYKTTIKFIEVNDPVHKEFYLIEIEQNYDSPKHHVTTKSYKFFKSALRDYMYECEGLKRDVGLS